MDVDGWDDKRFTSPNTGTCKYLGIYSATHNAAFGQHLASSVSIFSSDFFPVPLCTHSIHYTGVSIKKSESTFICMLAVCPHYPGSVAPCVSFSCAMVRR